MKDSLQPLRRWRAVSALASGLWWTLVVFWLLLALAWGTLHGWIVPRIDQWRPVLERQATQVLGIPVRIASVSARSDSIMPSIELRDVVLHDAQDRAALRLSRVVVALSPRSLWNLGFEQLYVEGPELDMRRSVDGRLWVAGMDVSRGGDDERAADWFFRQREVVVLGGTLRWTDELRGAPPLVLSDLQFVVRNGALRHALRLDATPPAAWGQRFSLRGVFRQPLLSTYPGRWQDWKGQMYADFDGVDLSHLRQYAHLGIEVR
ncbi:MAG: TIGR02099 family protein, partial [Ramlibacter sp.]